MDTEPGMMARLSWEENGQAIVHSYEELDVLVSHLTAEAIEQHWPFSVELSISTDTALAIVVGRDESHVEFYSARGNPLVVGCRGPWDSDELIEFSHRGQFCEMPKRYCVPIDWARDALKEYYHSGIRPTTIPWPD